MVGPIVKLKNVFQYNLEWLEINFDSFLSTAQRITKFVHIILEQARIYKKQG